MDRPRFCIQRFGLFLCLILIGVFAFDSATAAAERYGFKDDKLGESTQDFRSKHPSDSWAGQPPDGHDCWHDEDGKVSCPVKTTILGKKTVAFYQFMNDRLYQIQVPFFSVDFENMLAAVKDRYGVAEESTRDYQNRLGAHFPGRVASWTKDTDTIVLSEIGSNNVPMSGKVYTEYSWTFHSDPLKESLLQVVDESVLKELNNPKKPADF